MPRLTLSYCPSFRNHLDNSLTHVLLCQGYYTIHHFICESDCFSFSLAKNISPYTSISLIAFHHTLSSLQQKISLPSINPSFSSNISNRIVSHSVAPNGSIVSYSIAPNDNTVSYHIEKKPNILLSKHSSYSFPSASIRRVNGIYFTFHSYL